MNKRSAIADWMSICLLPHHAVPLSRSRSLATAVPSSVSSSSPPRCRRLRSIRPVRCFLIVSASSSRHHACWSCPPRLPPRLSCRGTGRGYEPAAGCGLFGCHRLVACLPHAVSTPRTIWLSPISSPSPREVCFHACADGGSFGCGADAMRSPLPASPFKRFNCF